MLDHLVRILLIVAVASPVAITGCSDSGGKVLLRIPDRDWDPKRPDPNTGWCGETCIQEAMAYFGSEVSQPAIYAAGHNPARPDLDYPEIDTALRVLSIKFIAWPEGDHDMVAFQQWVRDQILQNHPVLCGVKVYPSSDHGWVPDHFVLAVGYDRNGFYINTNIEGRMHISNQQLESYNLGYSFQNDQHRYFGRAIVGLTRTP